jgi:hypothetical protein
MTTRWVKITSVSDMYEAEAFAGRLHASGIGSRTIKASDAPGAWLTGSENPFGPIDVYVASEYADKAQELSRPNVSYDETGESPARRAVRLVGALLVVGSIVASVIAAVTNSL